MYADLIRALLAAAAAGVLPGYLWAAVLWPAAGLAERLAQASVLSVASVPAVALVLAKLAGTGISLWVALGSVAVVPGTGVGRPGAAAAAGHSRPPHNGADRGCADSGIGVEATRPGPRLAGDRHCRRTCPGWGIGCQGGQAGLDGGA